MPRGKMLLEVYLQQKFTALLKNTDYFFFIHSENKTAFPVHMRTIVYLKAWSAPIIPKVYTHVNITTITRFHAIFQHKNCRFLIKPKDQINQPKIARSIPCTPCECSSLTFIFLTIMNYIKL